MGEWRSRNLQNASEIGSQLHWSLEQRPELGSQSNESHLRSSHQNQFHLPSNWPNHRKYIRFSHHRKCVIALPHILQVIKWWCISKCTKILCWLNLHQILFLRFWKERFIGASNQEKVVVDGIYINSSTVRCQAPMFTWGTVNISISQVHQANLNFS